MTTRDPRPEDPHQQRLEAWARESSAVRGLSVDLPDETALVQGYHRSRRAPVPVPNPALLPHERRAAAQRAARARRIGVILANAGALALVLGVVLSGLPALGLLVLALGCWSGAAVQSVRAGRSYRSQQVTLSGGVADAWQDWNHARQQIEALDGAAEARAATGLNEAQMAALVHQLSSGSLTDAAADEARTWVYTAAARAVLLADAETRADQHVRREVAADALAWTPDGDLEALTRATEQARRVRPS